MGDRVVRGVLKRHVFNKRSQSQSRRDMSPSMNGERKPEKKKDEGKKRDPNAPYVVSTPRDAWFVADKMYMVDSQFSRIENIKTLETNHNVVIDLENSDENHLVWENYHELKEDHIKSFMSLRSNGLYLMIDSLIWEEPGHDYRSGRKAFDQINVNHIERIARLIMDNPKHFRKTQETLKDIDFTIQLFHADDHYQSVQRKLSKVISKNLEIFSRKQNLNWKFELVHQTTERDLTQFSIDIHLGTNSWYMGFVLADWKQSYPFLLTTRRYGSPIKDLLDLAEINSEMKVLDLDAGNAENMLELAKTKQCRTFGIANHRRQQEICEENIKCAEWQFDIQSENLDVVMMSEELDTISEWFNLKTIDRVLYNTNQKLNEAGMRDLFRKLMSIMDICKRGCIFLFLFPVDGEFSYWMNLHIEDNDDYELLIDTIYSEINKQSRVIKIIKV